MIEILREALEDLRERFFKVGITEKQLTENEAFVTAQRLILSLEIDELKFTENISDYVLGLIEEAEAFF